MDVTFIRQRKRELPVFITSESVGRKNSSTVWTLLSNLNLLSQIGSGIVLQKPFPPYRHIPGVTPHPIRDPRGHSYGIEEVHDAEPLPPELWQQNEDYLYGVDLYNFAYWWEAHEAWEGLWHQAEDTYRLFLQGLIQISAAFIKYHTRMLQTPAHHSLLLDATNYDKSLLNVITHQEIIWDSILPIFLETADTFFAPFFADSVTETTYCRNSVKPLILLVA